MKVDIKKQEDVAIIAIQEREANLSNSEQFKEFVFNEIENGSNQLIVSFEKVEYVDSSFLGALVAILKKLMVINGKLVLISLNEDIKHLFELTRLDKVFKVEDSTENAKKHF